MTFRWKDYTHGSKSGTMTLGATEFLRRFFLHVLPKGFVRIRHFGFLANRFRGFPPSLEPTTTRAQPIDAGRSSPRASAVREFFSLALPALRRKHGRDSEIYRCGISPMHVLRFFLTRPSITELGCARARRCIRLSSPGQRPLLRSSPDTLPCPYSTTHDLNPVPRCLLIVLLHPKLPFKSHNSPRPPQTQRLPPSLLIENASDRPSASPKNCS